MSKSVTRDFIFIIAQLLKLEGISFPFHHISQKLEDYSFHNSPTLAPLHPDPLLNIIQPFVLNYCIQLFWTFVPYQLSVWRPWVL